MVPHHRYINRALRLVVLAAALLIPLVFYLPANEVFELSKSLVLKVFGMLAAILLLWRQEPIRSRSLIGAALLLAAGLLSMLHTPMMAATLERLWELGAVAVLLWAAESGAVSRGRLLTVVLFSHLLVTMYGACQYLGFDQYLGSLYIKWTTFGPKRVYSTMGNPDFLAAQTSLILPLICCLYFGLRREGVRALLVLCFIFALPSLLYTQARGAYIGFLSACLALGWLIQRFIFRLSVWQLTKWAVSIGAAFTLLLFLLPTGRLFIERFKEFKDPVKASSVQIRLFYWYSGWLMGRVTPPIGSGLGAFHLAGARTQGEAQQIWNRKWPRAAEVVSPHLELYAHNDYVHLFAEIGPLGLGIYLWIMVSLLASGLSALKALKPEERLERWLLMGLLAAAVSFYVNSLTNFPLKVMANAHLFFACLAFMLLSFSSIKVKTLRLPQHRLVLLGTLVAGLFLMERGCAKLTASHYLKSGHQDLLDGQRMIQKGDTRKGTAQIEASFKSFKNSVRLRPYHTDAILVHYYSGKAHQHRDELDQAIQDYTRSLGVFKYFPEGYQARGLARLHQARQTKDPSLSAQRLKASLQDLQRALSLNPKDPLTCFLLGTSRQMQGQPAESITPLLDAIRYSQDRFPDANYALALSYTELNRLPEAQATLKAMLAKFPDHPGAKSLLAQLQTGKKPKTR